MNEQKDSGELLYHTACIGCDSSDAMAVYQKVTDDGEIKVDAFCFSCNKYFNTDEVENSGVKMVEPVSKRVEAVDFSEVEKLDCRGWRDRNITIYTSQKYGVRTEVADNYVVKARYYPSTLEGKIVGYKKRECPKDFHSIGSVKATNELFGQSVFEAGQKYLVITTGEEDALAFADVLRTPSKDGKGTEYWTPCVSVTCGDGSIVKQFKANFEYINSFERVILAFDNDESGQRYLEEAARLITPGKAFIAKFPSDVKDASDMLRSNRVTELKQVFWKAVPFSRVDVLHLSQMWDDFESEDSNLKIPFPPSWSHLNEMMNGGMEKGEITVIGALTSIGKTSIINNIVFNLIENTKFKVGAIYFEGTKREVVRDLLSLDAGINLRLTDRSNLDIDSLKRRFFESLVKKDQFVYVDHQGSISKSEIFDKMNYLAKAEGCDVIIIDPIQAGVNSSDNGAIIEFMDALLKFAKETDTCVVAVSHMRKPSDDNPHAVSEYNLMGCVDSDTEFFTGNGWKKISEFDENDLVLNYDIYTGKSSLEKPKAFIKKECDYFYQFKSSRGIDMVVSPEHRMIAKWQGWNYKFITAEEVVSKHNASTKGYCGRFPTTFEVESEGMDISDIDLRMAIAFQADGHMRNDLKEGNATFMFKKQRKIDRIMNLIKEGGYKHNSPFVSSKGVWCIRVHIPVYTKEFGDEWWKINTHQAQVIMDEFVHWDGYKNSYFTTNKNNADFMQYVFAMCGYRSRIYIQEKENHQSVVYVVRFSKNNTVAIANKDGKIPIEKIKSNDGYKYCFTTSTGAWVARRNGCIFPTGNSSSINQIAFNTILISRDKMNEDPVKRSATKLQLVKCRRTGLTGEAGWLRYDMQTTHLFATSNPYAEQTLPQEDERKSMTQPDVVVDF